MIRFGIIGTNWITEEFLRCANLHGDFKLEAVYSRTDEKAREFALKHKATHVFTDLEEMAKSDVIDAVYIATPNSLHAEQSILFLNNKKHVLCEKPIASNTTELKRMISSATQNNVLLMEAMKSTCLPNFKAIQENLGKAGKVRRYFSSYCQYSSRYDLYKAGKNPNAFNPKFSNGSLMDIGVYCIYPLVALFGVPESITASATILESGVDGAGSITMQYEDMDAIIIHGKITNSYISSEIQGEAGSIVIDKISRPGSVMVHYKDGSTENIAKDKSEDAMFYEVDEFIRTIKSGKIESGINTYELALQVMGVLDEVRRLSGVTFPADSK